MMTSDDRVESPASPSGRSLQTRAQIVALLAILVSGFGVRVTGLVNALHSTGYTWEDPDGYMAQAVRLAGPDGLGVDVRGGDVHHQRTAARGLAFVELDQVGPSGPQPAVVVSVPRR